MGKADHISQALHLNYAAGVSAPTSLDSLPVQPFLCPICVAAARIFLVESMRYSIWCATSGSCAALPQKSGWRVDDWVGDAQGLRS